MITEKVLGAYAAIGTLPPAEQARWYRHAAQEWGIKAFEIPLLAGSPLPPELVETFADISASLVVTLVAQWATLGQEHPKYGLGSADESARTAALADAREVLDHCTELAQNNIRICHLETHSGQRCGSTLAHGLALYRSLAELKDQIESTLPQTHLTLELTDNLPADHPIAFPGAKKACLNQDNAIEVLNALNQSADKPVGLIINWGRLLINGDKPLVNIGQILDSQVPLAGVILSGAGATPHGFADSHNSHLDPASGFSAEDAQACAQPA